MRNDNPNLHYCIVLTPGQVDFLTYDQQGTSRCATLLSLIQMTTIVLADGDDKNGTLVGQVNASIVGLADQWLINPKTAIMLIKYFNEQNLIRTESSALGSVHSILCLSRRLDCHPVSVIMRGRMASRAYPLPLTIPPMARPGLTMIFPSQARSLTSR